VSTASGIFPIALTFLYVCGNLNTSGLCSHCDRWKDLNAAGAVAGSIGGMIIALVTWLATAKGYKGSITVDTLSDQWVSFAGNAAAIISGGILSIGLSLWRPANFDWEKTRGMSVVEEQDLSATSSRTSVQSEKVKAKGAHSVEERRLVSGAEIDGLDLAALNRTFKKYSFVFTVVAVIITFVSRFFPSQSIVPRLHFYLGYPCASERRCIHLLTKILHVCDRCHVCESRPPPFV
jgi:hypothetical protein